MSTVTATALPAPEILAQGDVSVDISLLSFGELDARIDIGLATVANVESLRPYLQEMRERLHSQGKRTDLPDTPPGLTWTAWVTSKKDMLGTGQRLLKGDKVALIKLHDNLSLSSEVEPPACHAVSQSFPLDL